MLRWNFTVLCITYILYVYVYITSKIVCSPLISFYGVERRLYFDQQNMIFMSSACYPALQYIPGGNVVGQYMVAGREDKMRTSHLCCLALNLKGGA